MTESKHALEGLRHRLNALADPEALTRLPDLAQVPEDLRNLAQESSGFCAETRSALETLRKESQQADEELDRQELELLEALRAEGRKQTEHSSANLARAVYPVSLFGNIIAYFDTGPIKVGPMHADEAKALGRQLGLSKGQVAKAFKGLAGTSAKQLGRVYALYQTQATLLESRILEAVRNATLRDEIRSGERSRNQSALARQVCEQLNDRLSVILGYTSVGASQNDIPPGLEASLTAIADTAEAGRSLTESLFAFAGAEETDQAEQSLHSILNLQVGIASDRLPRQAEIDVALDAARDEIAIPAAELHRLVFSLFHVVLETLPPEAILQIQTSNPLGTNGDCIRLAIRDARGEPLDQQAMELTRGLTAFGPLEDDEKKLRLAGLQDMVERLGGRIEVQRGAAVMPSWEIDLPLSLAENGREPFFPEPPERPNFAVWLVDDDPIFRRTCRDSLDSSGNGRRSFEEFPDGLAMQAAWNSDKKPHLILLDYNMPDFNGLELREWLNDHGGAEIPVILVSGLDPSKGGIERALRLGRTYYLQKPLSAQSLEELACVALGETLMG